MASLLGVTVGVTVGIAVGESVGNAVGKNVGPGYPFSFDTDETAAFIIPDVFPKSKPKVGQTKKREMPMT